MIHLMIKIAPLIILGILFLESSALFDHEIFGRLWCLIGSHRFHQIIGGAPFSDLVKPLKNCRLCGHPKMSKKFARAVNRLSKPNEYDAHFKLADDLLKDEAQNKKNILYLKRNNK